MSPKLSIVIAVWDGLKHLVPCVESIYKHTKIPFELILVDNASTDGSAAYCDFIQTTKGNALTIHNDTNRGFGPAQNQGMQVASGDFVCALNSDVVVTPEWAERLLAHLTAERDHKVGMVSCMANHSAGRQIAAKGYKTLDQLDAYAAAWFAKYEGQAFEAGTLFGWLLMARRSDWEAIGGFDERFQNAFEDNDLSLRFTLAGMKLLVARDVFVHHEGQGTILSHFTVEQYAQNGYAQKKVFADKWRGNEKKKLVAVMRVANCERTIQRVLDRTAQFANAGIIAHICRSSDQTEAIVRAHPAVKRVEVYDGPFQEDFERNSLLQWALEMQARGEADWCISVDGDELYDNRMIERVQELMNPAWPHTFAYWCNWRTIWKTERNPECHCGTERSILTFSGHSEECDSKTVEYYRADDTFGRFKNYRMFRLIPGQKITSQHPEGHHCGSSPVFPVENLKWTNIRVKHLGYETPEIRKKKFDFYQAADNYKTRADIGHDDYSHLIDENVALKPWKDDNRISVCALVGNEGPWLPGFLEHLVQIADEFVIGNTLKEGEESDGSLEYLKQFVAVAGVPIKIVDLPWQDNYALMRNMLKEHASMEWCLMMDPDERFDPQDIQVILDMIDEPDVVAWLFHALNYLEPAQEGRQSKYISSDSMRLFRNIPEIFYTCLVHETLEDAITMIQARGSKLGHVAESKIGIHHHGYLKSPDKLKKKLAYYHELNQKEVLLTDGLDSRPYFNLGLHYLEEDDWDMAFASLRRSRDLRPDLVRPRTMLTAAYLKAAGHEMEQLVGMTPAESSVHQRAKEGLQLLERVAFRAAKVLKDHGGPGF